MDSRCTYDDTVTLQAPAKSIKIGPLAADTCGMNRRFSFAFGDGQAESFISLFGPMEPMPSTRTEAEIPKGHELVGVKLTLDDEGYVAWVNFWIWPTTQAFDSESVKKTKK